MNIKISNLWIIMLSHNHLASLYDLIPATESMRVFHVLRSKYSRVLRCLVLRVMRHSHDVLFIRCSLLARNVYVLFAPFSCVSNKILIHASSHISGPRNDTCSGRSSQYVLSQFHIILAYSAV